MTPAGDRIGIIAGSGKLPMHIAGFLSGSGRDVYVAALTGAAHPALEDPGWETEWYEVHSLRRLLNGLGKACVTEIVLAGKVEHCEIFSGKFDDAMENLLDSLPDQRPSTILGGLANLLTDKGFPVLPLGKAAPDLLPDAGHIAGPFLSPERIPDLELGWRTARGIADLDIGQTVIVKEGAVVAVEAMEGTDETIQRAGRIAGEGLALVKLAAADHDFRFDIPTVGPETVSWFAEAGGDVMAIEAGKSFVIEIGKVSALCNEKGITLFSGRETQNGEVLWPGS